MKRKVFLISALAIGMVSVYGQRWAPSSQERSEIRKEVEVQHSYRLDLQSLRSILKDAVETGKGAKAVTVSLPTVEGKMERFAVYSDPVMEKSMADRYQLGSYVGTGIDDPSKYLRFSTSPTEMQSMIIKDGIFQFIEPITVDKQVYGVFYKTKRTEGEHGFECTTQEKNFKDIKALEVNGKKSLSNINAGITDRPASTRFRTYRLALAVTGEYTKKFDPNGGTTNTVAQMNATMNRVNGIFQKDFGIRLVIQDLPNIIYTDPATDFYTPPASNNDPSFNLQLQQMLTQDVGNENYDMGHVFHVHATDGNGNAGSIGSTCVNPTTAEPLAKGSAFTQMPNPVGDVFDIDYAAHEMGHQLGANHTFSHKSEGSGANIEPGGGTTIMGYAGITGDNVQMSTDAYFHYFSVGQILDSLDGKPGCGTSQNITTNTAPVISSLPSMYSIPKGTAYYLEASATDADPIKYTWEQYDSVDLYHSVSGDIGWGYNPQGALTRSYFGTTSGRRYFPSLPIVMSGKLTDKTKWESVSYIPRLLHYAVTVRDENTTPMLVSAETTIDVKADGPFKFKGLSEATILYNNAANTISWDVVNTNNAPYNVSNVKIEYTTDLVNGSSWTELIASTPNTGSYTAQMPTGVTSPIKLKISAIGNIFYAVSPKIMIGTAPTSTTDAPTGVSATDADVLKTSAVIGWNAVPGATYSVNYRKTGTTNWANIPSTTNSVLLTTLEDETNYEVRVAAIVNTVTGAFSSPYAFKTKGLKTGDYCLMSTGGNSFANLALNSGLYKLKVANLTYSDSAYKTIFRTYLDYSEDASKLINLTKGTQYTLSYTDVGNKIGDDGYPDNVEVWIDYNRNGIFEDAEKIGSNSNATNNSLHVGTMTFTVPASAYGGDKMLRMRVASTSFTAGGPCGYPTYTEDGDIYSYGSFKDFPVKIAETLGTDEVRGAKPAEVSIYPNPADTFVEVKNLKGKADYKIYSADGRLVQEGKIDGQRINVASLIKGMYVITFKDDKNTYNTKLIKK